MRLVGTRDRLDTANFSDAAAGAVPVHGGLFTPATFPRWSDVDVLLFVVEQEGRGACHTGEHSCFFRAFGSGATPGPV